MGLKKEMQISRAWLQAAVLTFIAGFGVLGYLAAGMYSDQPPIPREVLNAEGRTLFTREDVTAGQNLFQRFGLMQFGTVFGHGAYPGPDFTARYLHLSGQEMLGFYRTKGMSEADAATRVKQDLKKNQYDQKTGKPVFSPGQAHAFDRMLDFNFPGGLSRGQNVFEQEPLARTAGRNGSRAVHRKERQNR